MCTVMDYLKTAGGIRTKATMSERIDLVGIVTVYENRTTGETITATKRTSHFIHRDNLTDTRQETGTGRSEWAPVTFDTVR